MAFRHYIQVVIKWSNDVDFMHIVFLYLLTGAPCMAFRMALDSWGVSLLPSSPLVW